MPISNHYASGYLSHTFFGDTIESPSHISIALTNSPVTVGQSGATISEIVQDVSGEDTGYRRCSLGAPSQSGVHMWKFRVYDVEDASGNLVEANVTDSGTLTNVNTLKFGRCLQSWGDIVAVAVMDSSSRGEGKVVASANLKEARQSVQGDNFVFDPEDLHISYN